MMCTPNTCVLSGPLSHLHVHGEDHETQQQKNAQHDEKANDFAPPHTQVGGPANRRDLFGDTPTTILRAPVEGTRAAACPVVRILPKCLPFDILACAAPH
eukprot:NODE_8100_length_386_cov_3.687259_g7934_i0.p2 GENE.NODE_8100_length_386_cov_3.687259_g7934_i0~~NODE_8100_length_386_cov_3.687259_g7934_i0.p2  ORF type:complete len:100 (+),score=6.68 NODE_8100_length_386_cov_3.687259_g7934_i0:85-384(+)